MWAGRAAVVLGRGASDRRRRRPRYHSVAPGQCSRCGSGRQRERAKQGRRRAFQSQWLNHTRQVGGHGHGHTAAEEEEACISSSSSSSRRSMQQQQKKVCSSSSSSMQQQQNAGVKREEGRWRRRRRRRGRRARGGGEAGRQAGSERRGRQAGRDPIRGTAHLVNSNRQPVRLTLAGHSPAFLFVSRARALWW